MTNSNAITKGEIVSARRIDFPRELVWIAWTDPVHLAKWWGPKEFTNTFHQFELKPGGVWEFTMHGPDGTDYPNQSRFVEITPPERLVFDHLSGHKFRVTTTFETIDQRTNVTFRMRFEDPDECERIRPFVTEANEQNFDRLEAELSKMA